MNSFALTTQSLLLENNNAKASLKIRFGRPIIVVENLYWHKIDVLIYGVEKMEQGQGLLIWHGGFSTMILGITIPARSTYEFKAPRPLGFGIVNYSVNVLCDFEVVNSDIEQKAFLIGVYMIPF